MSTARTGWYSNPSRRKRYRSIRGAGVNVRQSSKARDYGQIKWCSVTRPMPTDKTFCKGVGKKRAARKVAEARRVTR